MSMASELMPYFEAALAPQKSSGYPWELGPWYSLFIFFNLVIPLF
jgi:hypothetical protein